MNIEAYLQFIHDRRPALRSIASASRQSSTLDDVKNELWITANEVLMKTGVEIDFANVEHQGLILSWTRQRLVHWCDKKLRNARSFGRADNGGPDLAEILTLGSDENPTEVLSYSQDTLEHAAPSRHHSSGAAWLSLLKLCDNRMTEVAYFLKISLSHSYRCYAKVLESTQLQHHLPFLPPDGAGFWPRPWRRFKMYREPEQLALEFDKRVDLILNNSKKRGIVRQSDNHPADRIGMKSSGHAGRLNSHFIVYRYETNTFYGRNGISHSSVSVLSASRAFCTSIAISQALIEEIRIRVFNML